MKPLGAPQEVQVAGAERTSFYPVVQAMAAEFRFTIRPDARPEAGHYYRSDHFSLARVGIPAFSINEGAQSVTSEVRIGDNLNPDESVKVIINHVKKGVILAKNYKVPPRTLPWPASALPWGGKRRTSPTRSAGKREMSSKRRGWQANSRFPRHFEP